MDKDLEKSLQDLIRKSHQLARQSGELATKSKALIEQFRVIKKKESENHRNKLGKT